MQLLQKEEGECMITVVLEAAATERGRGVYDYGCTRRYMQLLQKEEGECMITVSVPPAAPGVGRVGQSSCRSERYLWR